LAVEIIHLDEIRVRGLAHRGPQSLEELAVRVPCLSKDAVIVVGDVEHLRGPTVIVQVLRSIMDWLRSSHAMELGYLVVPGGPDFRVGVGPS